jgi:hypothetical protein
MAVGRIVDHMPMYTIVGFVVGGIAVIVIMVGTAVDYPDLRKKGFSGQSVSDINGTIFMNGRTIIIISTNN